MPQQREAAILVGLYLCSLMPTRLLSSQLCMLSNIDPQARGNMACVVLPFTAHMRLIVMHTEQAWSPRLADPALAWWPLPKEPQSNSVMS